MLPDIATLENSKGETGPGLQLLLSAPRVGGGIVVVSLFYFKPEYAFGMLGWALALAYTAAAVFDTYLALRWYVRSHYLRRSTAEGAARAPSKAGGKREKSR